MPKRWSHRYKHNDEKLKTGDIFEVAEVIRNLAIRYADKDLPTGEKQMLAKAKRILASELMYARDLERGRGHGLPGRRARRCPRRRAGAGDAEPGQPHSGGAGAPDGRVGARTRDRSA